MSDKHRRLALRLCETDRTFVRTAAGWVGKCLHCNSKLFVDRDGETAATVEHIVARSRGGDDTDANLALACARCNQQKGRTLDLRPDHDPAYRDGIARLLERRAERLRRDPP